MSSEDPPSPCSEDFFSLPQELRALVFTHFYSGLILHSKKSPVETGCLTALLRVSKSVYKEAKAILYATAMWEGDYVLKTLLWPHQYTRPRAILDDRDLTPIQNITVDANVVLAFLKSTQRLSFPPARMPNIRKVYIEFCLPVNDTWLFYGWRSKRSPFPWRQQENHVNDERLEYFRSRGIDVWLLIKKALEVFFDDLQRCVAWIRQNRTCHIFLELNLQISQCQVS